ncbi:transglutaminase domain-containing protein [Desulfofundulus thermosubterraneus]|uniref:Transglutaminase-like superfamily protein n=1 Tax=Desulfofundulus thermosubterraneus DSM 16057 TaxID=1121432 RepID=A0A1M6IB98_9FIRM|nr:transglutaminase domain-containing protein [Desulfofundulus thermosubterraneus]SHJ31687.1 Transglutaminase-like superfamily protein [Desulfofundulus thermosubterraneus DSM 16057]
MDIKTILNWKNKNFHTVPAGGKYVGKITVNEIIQKKQLSGCHDHALLVGSILRKYGFPVVMVDATGIQFSLDYPKKTKSFSGHVFLEVYIDDKWILLDPTSGKYITNYNPFNPIIPIKLGQEYKGYYVMLKGLDPDDYGINNIQQLINKQIEYSNIIKNSIDSVSYPNHYAISNLCDLQNSICVRLSPGYTNNSQR